MRSILGRNRKQLTSRYSERRRIVFRSSSLALHVLLSWCPNLSLVRKWSIQLMGVGVEKSSRGFKKRIMMYTGIYENNVSWTATTPHDVSSIWHSDPKYNKPEVLQDQASWQSRLIPSKLPPSSFTSQSIRVCTPSHMSTDFSTVKIWAGLQAGQDFPPCKISGNFTKNVSLLRFNSSSFLLKCNYSSPV